jgi:hypothetical protein
MAEITHLKVKNLEGMLREFKRQAMITAETEVWLSSDEEGNNYSPLARIDNCYNVGVESDKSKLTLYPLS